MAESVLEVATGTVEHPSLGDMPKSWMTDPFALLDTMGLGFRASPSSVSYETLKQMAAHNTVLAAIHNTRITQASNFCQRQPNRYSIGFKVRHKDPHRKLTTGERDFAFEMEEMIQRCGWDKNPTRDDFTMFTKKVLRDRLRYDQQNFEIIRKRNGKPHSFYAVAADTMRIKQNKKRGGPLTMQQVHRVPRYVQVINGSIVNEYTVDELAWGISNPRTDLLAAGYGYSEEEQLITTITAHLWAEEWNRRMFSQGATTKGILNIQGNIPQQQLEAFRRQWLCAPGTARVYSRDGVVQMAAAFAAQNQVLATGSGSIAVGENPLVVWDGQRWVAARIHKIGPRKMGTVTLATGETEKAGTEHLFWKVLGSGETSWSKLRDLKQGDWIFKSASAIESGSAYRYSEYTDSDPRSVPFPAGKVGEDLWEVLGWLSGDGCIPGTTRSHNVQWHYHPVREKQIAKKHLAVLRSYGVVGVLKTVARKSRTASGVLHAPKLYISVCQKTFKTFLIDLGFTAADGWKGHPAKSVPESVFSVPLSHRTAYLRGLFSADGGKHTSTSQISQVCLTAMSDGLRNGVQKLLATVGHESRHTGLKGRKARRLYVLDAVRFVNEVGFIQPYKNELDARTYRLRTDLVSPDFARRHAMRIRNSQKWMTLTHNERLEVCKWSRGSVAANRLALAAYAHKCGVVIQDIGLRQVKVTSVVLGEVEEAYDLETLDSYTRRYALDGFVTHNTQVSGVSNAWRTPIMNSEGLNWINLQPTNNEMGYQAWMEYLIKIGCAIYLIDPSEINFDTRAGVGTQPMFMTTNEAQQKVSKDRGLQPLMRNYASLLNKHIIEPTDENWMIEFVGLDAKTEEQAIELRLKELQSYKTLNEVRREVDNLPPVEDGDIVLNPTYVGYKSQQAMQAQQAAMMSAQGGPPGMPPGMPPGKPGMPPGASGQPGQPPPPPESLFGRPGAPPQLPEFQTAEQQAGQHINDAVQNAQAKGKHPSNISETTTFSPEWSRTVHAALPPPDLQKARTVWIDVESD